MKTNKCKCGGKPVLYEEGMARKVYEDENWTTYFSESDGFVVECMECGAITRHYSDAERAIDAWNTWYGMGAHL